MKVQTKRILLRLLSIILIGFNVIGIESVGETDLFHEIKPFIERINKATLNNDLIEDDRAYQLLPIIKRHYEYHKWVEDKSKSLREHRYYLISQLKTYSMFIEKYYNTRAVLIARYLVAISLRDNDIGAWKDILKDVKNNFSNTFEADFFNYLLTTEYETKIKNTNKLLIWADKFDKDNSLYVNMEINFAKIRKKIIISRNSFTSRICVPRCWIY